MPNYYYYKLCIPRGVPRIWQGGGQELFSVKFGDLHVAKRHAVCYGVSEHAPPPLENIFLNGAISCVLVYIWVGFGL